MPSLAEVLEEATRREATEIVIEAGQVPMIHTASGGAELGERLRETDLFEALVQVLGFEQQAELAVGNFVEFDVELALGRWALVAEPGAQGLVLRGRRSTRSSSHNVEFGVSLDLPPLEHTENHVTRAPDVRPSVFIRGQDRSSASEPLETTPSWRTIPTPAPSTFSNRSPASRKQEAIPLPSAGEDDGVAADDAGLRTKQTLQLHGIAVPQARADRKHSSLVTLEDPLRALTPGSLCLVRSTGTTEPIEGSLEGEVVLVDGATPEHVFECAHQAAKTTTYVLRLEDPSARIAWILRRLEEGDRVIVPTRARTFEGARRILLGLFDSPRVERWLAMHRVCWLAPDDEGNWVLEDERSKDAPG